MTDRDPTAAGETGPAADEVVLVAERLNREVSRQQPNWQTVRSYARTLLSIATGQALAAWVDQAAELRAFATRVFHECQLRLASEPRCLPVMGAAGDETAVTIRGLVSDSRCPTQEYAEECLSELMVELFKEQHPRNGAIIFRALSEPDGGELLVIVAMDGATGHAASFVGPHPATNPEPPHLVAENPVPRHAERVESLEMLFAGRRAEIHFGDKTYWKTWLRKATANEN